MPPPAASVDFRPPSQSNSNFDSANNNNNYNDNNSNNDFPRAQNGNPRDSCTFNTGCSSSSFSGLGRPGPRPKPRLAKLRRSSKPSYLSSPSSVDTGVNPFRSVCSSNVGASNCSNSDDNSNDHYSNAVGVGFVFGVLNSNNNSNNNNNNNNKVDRNDDTSSNDVAAEVDNNVSNLKKGDFSSSEKQEELRSNGNKGGNCWVEGVAFAINDAVSNQISDCNGKCGDAGEKLGLSEELRKLNIENDEKGSCSGEKVVGEIYADVANGGDRFFVFKSGGVDSGVSSGSSGQRNSQASNKNLNGTNESVGHAGKDSGFGSESVEGGVFVFGSSGDSTRPGYSSSRSSGEVDRGIVEEENVLRSSFSSSNLGAEAGSGMPQGWTLDGEGEVDFSSSSMPEGNGASLEFKLPEFDSPLSFSANLPSGFGGNLESSVRTRRLREKYLKKTKVKPKKSDPNTKQPIQKSISGKSVVQEQEAPECYSPMDFSPYEESAAGNDVPLSGHQGTGQANVESGNSSAVYTESQPNLVFMSNGQGVGSTDSSAGFSSNMSSLDGIGAQFSSSSDVACSGEEKFAFTASSSVQNHVSSVKRHQKKKYRLKTESVAGRTSMAPSGSSNGVPLFTKLQGQSGNFPVSAGNDKHKTKGDDKQGCESGSAFSAAEKACDKWRRRGNEAYEKGELFEAEDFYTWGVSCISPGDASGVAFTPLVRCYSNRAATRMALGRVREALQDCLMAVKLDPTFHRAQMRAANCYLQLGELEHAMKCFRNCMDSAANVVCLDRQVILSASEGIQKSQKVIESTNCAAELLKLRTSEAAASALESIAEAMSTSLHSEKLLQMKAEALCLLRRHEEAITLCQQTLDFAEKNFIAATPGDFGADSSCLNVRLWRHHILSKCHFHLGKLEVALDLIEKQEVGDETQESSDPFAVTIRELLMQKSAGNTAFQSGKHAEAIEHYTSAILNSMESRPFAAICFCNRAAAHQALGQIADAIADCSLAIALDEHYAKAVSRRATLHEMIRDYKQAAVDLQRLASLLQKQSLHKSKQSGSGNGKELRQVQRRLSMTEEEAKRDVPLDFYLILGIKKSDSASEIKKAYRKAALRHHPDKAGQSLVRGDAGDEGRLWKDIVELVYKDSDRLFKMIGEAYAVLSDPTKREEYDHEEDMRKALRDSNNIRSTGRRQSYYYTSQDYPFERSSNRRHWQESYRTYSYSHRQW